MKGKSGGGGLALEVSVSEAEGSGWTEAEREETVLVVETNAGIVVETLERKKKDGLGRRTINGIAFRNRDMLSERLKLGVKERDWKKGEFRN